MQFTVAAIVSALAGAAVAQSGCQAQNILDACTAQLQPALQSCAVQDWNCMCDKSTQLLTCYNNCPSDPGRSGVSSENTQYCNAAKAYGSSSSSGSASATATSSGGSSMASATVPTSASASPTLPAGVTASSSSTAEATASGKAVNGSGTGAGAHVAPVFGASMGGLVAVVAGAVFLL